MSSANHVLVFPLFSLTLATDPEGYRGPTSSLDKIMMYFFLECTQFCLLDEVKKPDRTKLQTPDGHPSENLAMKKGVCITETYKGAFNVFVTERPLGNS